jgi:hypothetical protein
VLKTIITKDLVNRSDWSSGPWDDEPDKKQWEDTETKYPCLIVRNNLGNLCGYVGISKSHPMFEKDYDSIDVTCHGGLTYASKCYHNICHVVSENEDDNIWWLGFDCAHYNDLSPHLKMFNREGIYRDFNYVENECTNLAKQLKELESA